MAVVLSMALTALGIVPALALGVPEAVGILAWFVFCLAWGVVCGFVAGRLAP